MRHPGRQHLVHRIDAKLGNRPPLGVEHTRRAARDDEPRCRHDDGQVRGQDISVDVEQNAVPVDTDARDDGDATGPNQIGQERCVCAVRLAHQAEIGELARYRPERRGPTRQPNPAVGAGESNGAATGCADRGDERRVRSSGEHRNDRVERRLVGDPQAVDEARRLAPRA